MRIKITILISFLLGCLTLTAQNYEWTSTISDPNNYQSSITQDAHGNVYTVGAFTKTVDFDPGSGTTNLTSVGQTDVFIQKLDASGKLIWAKSFGGSSDDFAADVEVDAIGNIYVTGNFHGTADFDPGVDTNNHTSAGSGDVFIQKLDSSGNFIWVRCFGGSSSDWPNTFQLDAFGHIYSSGSFNGTVDFDPGPGVHNLSVGSGTWFDPFIHKMDTAGNFIWARSFGGADREVVWDIEVNSMGAVYTSGWYRGNADFDPGTGAHFLNVGSIATSFVQKLDSAGNFIWVKNFSGTASSEAKSIETDVNGNVYTIGDFGGTTDFDPGSGTSNLTSLGSSAIYVQKMDAAGNFIWAKQFGGVGSEQAQAATLGKDGSIYSIGSFSDTVDFDPGSGVFKLSSNGSGDIFIQKMDTAGKFVWAVSYGGTSYDFSGGLSVSTSNTVYSTGFFEGSVDFDPGAGIDTINGGNSYDLFTNKLSQCTNTTSTDVRSACDSLKWIDGKTYTTSTNSATYTLANAGGCDSIITLNLTINTPTSGVDQITACGSLKWIDGNTYTMSNNTATHTLPNSAGCDSVVTLDLTINTVNTSVTRDGITLTAIDSNASYQWIDCNNGNAPISGDTNKTFTATANGSYALVISKNNCTDTSSCVEITQVGIGSHFAYNSVSIYPNPTTGVVYIDLERMEDVSIEVVNAMGQVVYEQNQLNSNHQQLTLNEGPGVYFIKVTSQGEMATFKVIHE